MNEITCFVTSLCKACYLPFLIMIKEDKIIDVSKCKQKYYVGV